MLVILVEYIFLITFYGLFFNHQIHIFFIKVQMLLIDEHKFKQKCNNFGYLSIQVWLKGNDTLYLTER